MDARRSAIAIGVLLAVATSFAFWFDYAAATSILFPARDTSGHAVFQVPGYQNTVYPFTYVGVALSVVGVAYFIFRRERSEARPILAAALALLIANLASIGMINSYEQVWVGLNALTPHGHAAGSFWLGIYWGTVNQFALTLAGMLLVLTILPWTRRDNWPGVTVASVAFVMAFALWYQHGLYNPEQGDALDYAYNALTRITSQLALVAAVSSRDYVRFAGTLLRSRWKRRSRIHGAAAPERAVAETGQR